ncbi:MAG: hypothetical protein A2W80_02805 [Candidatus Riflebacteria bacterium GWC2_50_8]|nr:MAG: hypothetical protein A2W80_02805 [Candidatus Riflebacteria bacterium GWC2_50_8]
MRDFARKAFTVVELLVAVGLVSLVGIVTMRLFSSIGSTQQNMSQQAMLQMDSRKAFDNIVDQIRMGTDIVRPTTGETLPYMVFKDVVNQMTILYLEPNNKVADSLEQRVFRLISYRNDYSGVYQPDNEKVLLDSIKQLRFTSLSPTSVQVNATIVNEKGDYQFLAHVGLMNLGGLD